MSDYQQTLQQALSFLHAGDAQKAVHTIRPVLGYPGLVDKPEEFSEALEALAEISMYIGEPQFASRLRSASRTPTDMNQLYRVGFEMINHGLSDMAATVLAYAHRLDPDNAEVLHELSASLGNGTRYAEARSFLQESPRLVQHNFLTCYLLAFNALMSGDLETPCQLLPALRRLEPTDVSYSQMTERITTQLERADALNGHTSLDYHDLRGWHLVLTGSLLLHLSPHGYHNSMHGRYVWVQDSYGLCLLGIQRVQAVLKALQIRISRIWLLPDRNSQIFAHAAARILDLPLKPWPVDSLVEDEPQLLALARAAALAEENILALSCEEGQRQKLWVGSPVPSNFFS